jgi:hypothetical protein
VDLEEVLWRKCYRNTEVSDMECNQHPKKKGNKDNDDMYTWTTPWMNFHTPMMLR